MPGAIGQDSSDPGRLLLLQLLHFELQLPVRGELILKPLREADRVLGSESANGT